MPSPALRLPAVAEELDIHEETARRLVASGELDAFRVGRSIRVTRAALDAYIRENAAVRA